MVLGFSMGFRKDGVPTVSNMFLLGRLVGSKIRVDSFALQLELAEIAKSLFPNLKIDKVIYTGREGLVYRFGTEEIVRQGVEYAVQNGCNIIYILAYPLVHRQFCWLLAKRYAKRYGIAVKILRTGWIPCDRRSDQWFTRHPLLVAIYTIVRTICKIFSRRSAV